MRETILQTPRPVKKDGRGAAWAGGAPGTGADSPAACGEEHDVAPTLPMDDHVREDIHSAAHGRPHVTRRGCALKEAAGHGEPTQEQDPGRNCGPYRTAPTVFSDMNCVK